VSWPTAEQFDAASAAGATYARDQIANGAEAPFDGPLSGEWADGPTERSIAGEVSYYPNYDSMETGDDLTELGNAWERGYFDVFEHQGDE
jgi:hypothetical protein